MWFINKLSHRYTANITINATLTNPRPNELITGSATLPLQLRVQSSGFNIARYNILSNKYLEVDLSYHRPQQTSTTNRYLLTNQIKNLIITGLGADFDLLSVEPDSLLFQVATVTAKKVPVKANLRISYAPQYQQYGKTMLQPDSVFIRGPLEVIEQIQEVNTELVTKNNLSSTLSGTVRVVPVDDIFISTENIYYSADIQRYTEESLQLPIGVRNLDEHADIELFPSVATVTLFVTTEEYNRLQSLPVKVWVDYHEVAASISGKLSLKVDSLPSYVLSTQTSPPFVDYIIKPKK
jgi:hypothetical protein